MMILVAQKSLQAGLKRALHASMGGKESFQLIRFGGKGEPRLWAQDLMAPTETALQAAEEWIEQLRPAERSNLVEAGSSLGLGGDLLP